MTSDAVIAEIKIVAGAVLGVGTGVITLLQDVQVVLSCIALTLGIISAVIGIKAGMEQSRKNRENSNLLYNSKNKTEKLNNEKQDS